MTIIYDQPRPAMKIVQGDLVELYNISITKKFFKKVMHKKVIGYGIIVDFNFDSGYTAIIDVAGKIVTHAPEDLKLVQRIENRAKDLIEEIEEYLIEK